MPRPRGPLLSLLDRQPFDPRHIVAGAPGATERGRAGARDTQAARIARSRAAIRAALLRDLAAEDPEMERLLIARQHLHANWRSRASRRRM